MITFIDGPAAGQRLQLRRVPLMLRVVVDREDPRGIDALDQLDDEPKTSEDIWVYQLTGPPGSYHILRRGTNGSGWYRSGEYQLYAEQPSDQVARTTELWQRWANVQARPDWMGQP